MHAPPAASRGRVRALDVSAWRTFARLFAGSGRLLAASLALSLLQSALLVPVAFVLRHVFDDVLPSRDESGVAFFGGLLLALYVAGAAVNLVNRWLVLRAAK